MYPTNNPDSMASSIEFFWYVMITCLIMIVIGHVYRKYRENSKQPMEVSDE